MQYQQVGEHGDTHIILSVQRIEGGQRARKQLYKQGQADRLWTGDETQDQHVQLEETSKRWAMGHSY